MVAVGGESLCDGGEAPGRKRIGRRVLLEVGHRLDGRLDLDAVLFLRLLPDVAPFAEVLSVGQRSLLECGVDEHRVVAHPDREVVVPLVAGQQRITHPLVDKPFEVRDPIRRLAAQRAKDAFLRGEFDCHEDSHTEVWRPAFAGRQTS